MTIEKCQSDREPDGDFLAPLGADGQKWAQEFRKMALELGYSDIDEGWLIGWFANAIMAGWDHGRRSLAATVAREAGTMLWSDFQALGKENTMASDRERMAFDMCDSIWPHEPCYCRKEGRLLTDGEKCTGPVCAEALRAADCAIALGARAPDPVEELVAAAFYAYVRAIDQGSVAVWSQQPEDIQRAFWAVVRHVLANAPRTQNPRENEGA